MAQAFSEVWRRRLVDGLFLSSGIIGGAETTMTRLLDTVHIIRDKYRYRGYIHLKIMPGSSSSCIGESIKLANRISVNIESPTEEDLSNLSPEKNLKTGFFDTIFKIKSELSKANTVGRKVPSLTTQFVVGAGQEKDADIVKTTELLYQQFQFKRIFYSAFRPIPETPLENLPATPMVRQNRLYQADFLMRFYRFKPSEFNFDLFGNLNLNEDPKTLWAKNHSQIFPININKADYWQLLRIPGVGPATAKKIIQQRGKGEILKIVNRKSSAYITI